MPPKLDNLDRDSLLLLYLADELPAVERQRVQQRLGDEPALAEALADLRALEATADAALRRADAARPLPMSAEVAVRRFARDAGQWNVDRLARRQPEAPARRGWNLRALSGVAAVAILALTLFVWYRLSRDDNMVATTQNSTMTSSDDPTLADNTNANNGGPDNVTSPVDVINDPAAAVTDAPALAMDDARQRYGTAEQELEA